MSDTYRVDESLPVTVNLNELVPGDHWVKSFFLKDGNGDAHPGVGDMEAYLVAKDRANGKTYLDLSVGNGITRNVASGAFVIMATPTDTEGVDVSRLAYSFRIVDGDGIEKTFFDGFIPVNMGAR